MDTRDFDKIERYMDEFRRDNPGQREGFYKEEEMRLVRLCKTNREAFLNEVNRPEESQTITNKDKRRAFVEQNRVETEHDNVIPFSKGKKEQEKRNIKGIMMKALAAGVAATFIFVGGHHVRENIKTEKPETATVDTTKPVQKVTTKEDILRDCRVMIAAELNDKYKDDIEAGKKEAYSANNLHIWKDEYGLHLLEESPKSGDPEYDYHNEVARCKPYLEYESVAKEKGDYEILDEYAHMIQNGTLLGGNSDQFVLDQNAIMKRQHIERLAEKGIKLNDKDFEQARDKENVKMVVQNTITGEEMELD